MRNVTHLVEFGNSDDEYLPLTQCVCRAKFDLWDETVSIYSDDPWICPKCKAKLYFGSTVTVFEVIPDQLEVCPLCKKGLDEHHQEGNVYTCP